MKLIDKQYYLTTNLGWATSTVPHALNLDLRDGIINYAIQAPVLQPTKTPKAIWRQDIKDVEAQAQTHNIWFTRCVTLPLCHGDVDTESVNPF